MEVGSVPEPYRERFRLRFISREKAGPAAARNIGAGEASGRYLAFLDDDCRPGADWLAALERGLSGADGRAVGGRTVNGLKENIYSSASQMLAAYQYDFYNSDPRRARFLASNNLALAREDFDRIGGFNPRFSLAGGEDREFCDRLLTAGLDLVYLPEAVVFHYHRLSLSGFWRQNYNYGRGARLLRRSLAGPPGAGPAGFEPLRFYWDLIRYPLTGGKGRRPAAAGLLMILSQLAVAQGFFSELVLPEASRERGEGRPV